MSSQKKIQEKKGGKDEKGEKSEKTEKHEKGEFGILGQLIGGLILIFIGITSYLQISGYVRSDILWAFFLIVVGILIIVGAIFATRRHRCLLVRCC